VTDFSHCGVDGFSPPAPPEICNQQFHTVPEPSALPLVLVALAIMAFLRRKRDNVRDAVQADSR
jgi:hypothetical protein